MPSYNVYHVVPRDGRWVARLQGSPTVSAEADSRAEVVRQAEQILRQLGAGRIVLHGDDGAIERVETFEQIGAERSGGVPRPVLLGIAAACFVGLGIALARRR